MYELQSLFSVERYRIIMYGELECMGREVVVV